MRILGRLLGVSLFLIWASALAPTAALGENKYGFGQKNFAKFLEYPDAEKVGSDQCQACHQGEFKSFRHSAHSLQALECEDCHGAGSLHVKSGDGSGWIVRFKQQPVEAANGACLSCHNQSEKLHNWLTGSHAANGVRCVDCHEVHAQEIQAGTQTRMNFETMTPGSVTVLSRLEPESSVRLESRSKTNDACLKCHQAQRAEMSLPYHHPLREGKISCVDCHNPHGGPAGNNLRTANGNQLCLTCHAQYRGPFSYQHPPVTENCLICHSPHGSPNAQLLTVSQPALCIQCHSDHHNGANLPLVDRCTNCHGSIHGSDIGTATGGSRFLDKGGLGVPGFPQPAAAGNLAARGSSMALVPVAAHSAVVGNTFAHTPVSAASSLSQPALMASHAVTALPAMAPFAGAMANVFSAFPGGVSAGTAAPADVVTSPDSYWSLYFTPGAYRFLNVTGYGGRVGEYDSLQEAFGGQFESAYISVPHHLSLLTRGTVLTGSDFDITSQFNLGRELEVGADIRSFFEQQDDNPFYSSVISPDIGTTDLITPGSVFGVKRRLGNAYARLKLPNLPVHLFVKGGWQARVGHTQLAYFDENIDTTCTTCHFTSQLQALNYTTRDIGGGVEVNVRGVDLKYEHDFSSFNDRLPFPSAALGPMLTEIEPGPIPVPDTPAGTYYLNIPAPSQYSADSLSLSWTASPKLAFNGQASYRRGRDVFTGHPQNEFDSDTTLSWHPQDRLRLTADYHQQNLVNDFVPYFAYFGNMSYHKHWAGLKADYELANHLDFETYYRYTGISRSNAFLWPQIYSFDNTDLLQVVPSSSSNTTGLALRYHGGGWSARAGYEWTGTQNPGYLTDPMNNNRIFGNVTLTPAHWLTFTNDNSFIVQNGFPVIQRRNRFYTETADAALTFGPNWNLDLGYSYQQDNLVTYMAFQNDRGVHYVIDEPFVPYRQLSQTYWVQSAYKFKQRWGLNLGLSHNSAHSGMLPDVNPNDYLQLGNASFVEQGTFNSGLFQQALGAVELGSTLGSQVNVPQLIGQGKVFYLLPRGFDTGFLIYYGSYRDFTNPNLNGILRGYNIYFGRSW
jgi:predicted CXXCH cytochrome family protein